MENLLHILSKEDIISKYILTIQYFVSYKPLFRKYIMQKRLLNIFAWIYLYTIGLMLPPKLNKWAKNIISDTNSVSQHISSSQNKPTAQLIIKDIKPWNDPQIEKLLYKTSQEPYNTVFFELSKDLSKVNKELELKNISFDNQNQASFFHRVALSSMYSIKDDIFSKEEFYNIYIKVTILYLTKIMDKPYDKKLSDEHIKNISKDAQLINLSMKAANISRKHCVCVVDYVNKQYKLKPELLHLLGVNSGPASIIEDSNIQNQSQYLYR